MLWIMHQQFKITQILAEYIIKTPWNSVFTPSNSALSDFAESPGVKRSFAEFDYFTENSVNRCLFGSQHSTDVVNYAL